ncbi:YcgL domain-containing protein [Cognatilysobacter lacus]|uniref:YcgL domain-containing protein FW784_08805 n=1 Tax=Cognatilysobacter lacus TaxID=1643323 RepID=A0A5D8Z3J5_9GAMM|nr:YcgL domain-containing protein [Lysobacter lacus]TZF89331.1 YcgL domain-containing protein [Lysobacter lacus]
MHAYVYKSLRKADTYIYLAERDAFDALPPPVREQLGGLDFVLDVELTPERRLARVDVAKLREALGTRGFFVQVPPPADAAAYDAGEYYRSRDA